MFTEKQQKEIIARMAEDAEDGVEDEFIDKLWAVGSLYPGISNANAITILESWLGIATDHKKMQTAKNSCYKLRPKSILQYPELGKCFECGKNTGNKTICICYKCFPPVRYKELDRDFFKA